MIIFGSRGLTSVVETGQFNCPQCGTPQEFRLKQVRNFFTLYFIPLIPLDIAGRYIECGSCRGTFEEEMKTYDPAQERIEMQTQMLRVMIMAALADGGVDDIERAEIKRQFLELSELPVADETLNREIAMATSAGADLNSYVATIADNLSGHGMGLVVKLAYFTMSAGGDLRPGHQTQLAKLAETLGIPQDQFMELINHFTDPDGE